MREISRLQDAVTRILKLKFNWAGHVARANNLTNTIHNWTPRTDTRARGRPAARWGDDITRTFGRTWQRLAKNREQWKSMQEAYVQEWTALAQ